jgi:hypothetical protein
MKNLKHYLTATFGLILFVSAIAFSLPQIGHANFTAAASDKDVVVINTPAQAVPVAVQGTANVSVANTPTVNAKQSGAWTVGISGTPTVEIDNAAGSAIAVRDVDRPTAQPFQYEAVVTVEDGFQGGNAAIPVPSGKLLVIENVSAHGSAPDSQRIQTFSINTHVAPDNVLRPHYLQFTKQDTGFNSYEYTVSQQTRIYADTPSASAYVFRATSSGTATFRFVVSGYFVNK